MITLSDAEWATAAVAMMEAKYLVSLMSPVSMIATPSTITSDNHIKLEMDDIEAAAEGYIVPSRAHVEVLLDFGDRLDANTEVVVHCAMGMSRSPAAVMILLAQWNPGREKEIVDVVFRGAPRAHPNRLLLHIGDDLLGCGGDLVSAAFSGPQAAPSQQPTYRGALNTFHSFPLDLNSL
jgi:predicted protein tyrosine phosphatase